MFWYLMLMLFSPLYLMFGLVFRGEQTRLVLALYHQVLILQRQLGKRPSLAPIERLALVLSILLLGKEKLRKALLIVQPATLVGWHRAIVRRHWRFLSKRKPGRPPKITSEMEQWVLRIARENPWLGYGKIAGEMRKLGFVRFGRSSVARILRKHGLTPERRHSCGLGWLPFFAHYRRFIWASAFCTVTTATLRTYYVVFFLEIGTRRIIHWNASTSPDEVWVAQQFRNLSVVSDDLPRYLIHDRDSKYTRYADSLLQDVGTKVIRLPVRSPDLNGHAERWIRSLRQECLDTHHHPERSTLALGAERVRALLQRTSPSSVTGASAAGGAARVPVSWRDRFSTRARRPHQRLLPPRRLTESWVRSTMRCRSCTPGVALWGSSWQTLPTREPPET